MKKQSGPQGLILCLFTDIENSTDLSKGLHPEIWKRVATQHDAILTSCITQRGGKPERTEGDSFFATFADPKAALECAVAIEEALHKDGKPLLNVEKNGETYPLKVRIGVHLAARAAYRTEQGAFRDTQVSQSQRIMDCGYGGQIVVSEAAWSAAHDYLPQEFRRWENRDVKNIDGPQTLYELLWNSESLGKIRAPLWVASWLRRAEDSFVAREDELHQKIELTLQSGSRLALLHGEGGIGKTRLALETARRMDAWFGGRIFGIAFDQLKERDPERVTGSEIVRQIGLALHAPPEIVETADPGALTTYLRRRFFNDPFLLVLDNFENANNRQTRARLGELLGEVPNLRCLVTCRMQFNLTPYTFAFEITGLSVPTQPADPLQEFAGYRLFCERASACDRPPELDDTASLVLQRRVMNLPVDS